MNEDPQSLCPPVGPPLAAYRREVPVGFDRLYENILDWQRLPCVHREWISAVACHDASARGWRATITLVDGTERLADVRLERREQRWLVRILGGPLAGAEVRSQAHAVAEERIQIVAELFAAVTPLMDRPALAQRFCRRWASVWDVDVAMMVERQRQIDRRIDGVQGTAPQKRLGLLDQLRLPMRFDLAGRAYVLAEVDGELLAFSARCPHQLGPLGGTVNADGTVTCPWHGYRFDVRSGANLSGGACRLGRRPAVSIGTDGTVVVGFKPVGHGVAQGDPRER
jgi:nitrite reductase/ring-hydroxylating ferredoxin subunit